MPEILPRHYLIGIVMFTFMIVGGVALLSEFQSQDSTFADDDQFTEFNKSFNKLNDVTTQVDNLQDTIEEAETDFGAFGVLNALISSSWQALKLLFNSLSFMDGAFEGMTAIFGVPAWIPTLILLLISIMIIFAIFSAIFQREL